MKFFKFLNNNLNLFALLFIISIYFLLRFSFSETIEFGYDQPRLASTVVDFLKNGNFLDSQNFSLQSPWGNLSWGPILVWFYSIFLSISKDPIVVSKMVIVFNLLSIIGVYYIGKRYFSSRVGLIASLILSVHPWWVIFSRMIYQPSTIPTFITISILLLFLTIEKPKSWWPSLLILSWGVLVQSYLITLSFILTSIGILIFVFYKKGFWLKSLLLGVVLNLIIFLPSFYFYFKNPDLFSKFFETGGKYTTNIFIVLKNYLEFISGLGLNWQLGYGYQEFSEKINFFPLISQVCLIVFAVMIIYGFLKSLKSKNIYFVSVALFLLAPIWMIPFIGVENVVPRYFLYTLPGLVILISLSLIEVSKFIKKFSLVFCVLFPFWSAYLLFNYFTFVSNYSYPNGFLSHYSDVPFSFLDSSFKWILSDAKQKGFSEVTVSDNKSLPNEFSLNQSQRYYWEYLLNNTQETSEKNVGHYLMYFSYPEDISENYKQFGPYRVLYINTKN